MRAGGAAGRTGGKGGHVGTPGLSACDGRAGPQAVRSPGPPATTQSPALSALSNASRSPGRCTSWYACSAAPPSDTARGDARGDPKCTIPLTCPGIARLS